MLRSQYAALQTQLPILQSTDKGSKLLWQHLLLLLRVCLIDLCILLTSCSLVVPYCRMCHLATMSYRFGMTGDGTGPLLTVQLPILLLLLLLVPVVMLLLSGLALPNSPASAERHSSSLWLVLLAPRLLFTSLLPPPLLLLLLLHLSLPFTLSAVKLPAVAVVVCCWLLDHFGLQLLSALARNCSTGVEATVSPTTMATAFLPSC